MTTLTEQLDLMLTLKPNWDGYNADPIQPEVIEVAKEFIGVRMRCSAAAGTRPGCTWPLVEMAESSWSGRTPTLNTR